jgi:sialate O-acetylesterase
MVDAVCAIRAAYRRADGAGAPHSGGPARAAAIIDALRAFAIFFVVGCGALADVRLPAILASHMVLQRGAPVHIWGKAHPGEAVTVTFRNETKTTAASGDGLWSVFLGPGEAGGPFELTVRGLNAIVLQDVLVGDVWLAAGQSNMEWPLRWAADPDVEIAQSRHPQIRLYRAMHRVSEYPLDDAWGKTWSACGPDSVADFSAAGYHFARQIQSAAGVPIGMIQAAWGGTPIDSWTSLRAIAADATLMPSLAEWARTMEKHPAALLRYNRELREWKAAAARAQAAGQSPPAEPAKPHGPDSPWKPGAIYNAMIAPLTGYPIRGVIWYQGESNTAPERAPIYGRLFRAMIEDWRRAWAQPELPFLYVQLASYRSAPGSLWPEVREAQSEALSLANTAMAVTIDIGEPDNIHPKNKREVGRRLSLAARALVYGEAIEHSGPRFRQAAPEGDALRLWFDHVGGGLVARGGKLKGFEVAGADGQFAPAAARIDGATVVAASGAVPSPVRVRYAWADNPDGNLFNSEGLPASPFRSR